MSTPILLPSPAEVAERIRDCREELDALRRLMRASIAAYQADDAKSRRRQSTAEAATA